MVVCLRELGMWGRGGLDRPRSTIGGCPTRLRDGGIVRKSETCSFVRILHQDGIGEVEESIVSSSFFVDMTDSVERVLAAAIEGHAQSLRFIQQQLSKLHSALGKSGPEIRNAIKNESKHTAAEVELQYALALEAVAAFFNESNFEKALHREYSISRLENSPTNLTPHGVAYIVPSRFNLFYSCVTAVAAAISAGNCVILEVSQSDGAFIVTKQESHVFVSSCQRLCPQLRRYFRELLQLR